MATDVAMPDAKDKVPPAKEPLKEPKKEAPADPFEAVVDDMMRNIGILEKAVTAKELRLLSRVLRATGSLRKRLNGFVLSTFIRVYVPASYKARDEILAALARAPAPMEEGTTGKKNTSSLTSSMSLGPAMANLLELNVYLHVLAVIVLIDSKSYDDALSISKLLVVDVLAQHNRRTLDELSARAYFFYARSVELSSAGNLSSIRTQLLAWYRTATLHRDYASQAVLLNLLLRNYIAYNLYDQADKFIACAPFPETRSNNQLARHLYYTGRVKAMQLDYNLALTKLQEAYRKAPQHTALGFRTSTQKFMIIVQLLTGEIPERAVFRQNNMQAPLKPYLALTKAIRVGDLANFKKVTEVSADTFIKDQTMPLIARLRQNVIKAGLRKLNTSYSRISLQEICTRLDLGTAQNAEGVVAKAIHDRVIDAVIDHEKGFVKSNETIDVYSTTEPTEAYHGRINFCLNVYNEAIKAMRFPEKEKDEETPQQRRDRIKEQEELAKSIAEEAEEDEDEFA